MLYAIAINLVWPEQTLRKYFDEISKHGFRKHELRSSLPKIIIGLCFVFSYPHVDFPVLWVVLGFLALLVPVFFLLKKSADQDVESMFENVNEEIIQSGIKKRRVQSIYKTAMLVAWLFSWRQIVT